MLCCTHCSQLSTILLHLIQAQQYCSILLTSVGSKTLFNPVKQQSQHFYVCTVLLVSGKICYTLCNPNMAVSVKQQQVKIFCI